MNSAPQVRAEALVDLGAIAHNVGVLLGRARAVDPAAGLMAVVKADGYGHGATQVARAAVSAGATALGVATPDEALALGPQPVPVLAWLWGPGEDPGPALAAGVQLAVYSVAHLEAVLATGRPAVVHLKIDTGLGRGGATPRDWPELLARAAAAQRAGRIRVHGVMSHLAGADVPGDASVDEQLAAFRSALARVAAAGLRPAVRHLANTPGLLTRPDTVFDLVRSGIGVVGIDPVTDGSGADLRPAMTLTARVALTKRVPAGHGVSYGWAHVTDRPTTLALVPVGYADGIPRSASGRAEVALHGRRYRIAGRVAMDQFVLDCGDDPVAPGDLVTLFGPGTHGEPTAVEWGAAAGTIGYEIVTRIGPRVPRRYTEGVAR